MELGQPLNFKFTRLHLIGTILTVLGIVLFIYFVSQAGVEEIWSGISKLGFGFLVILGIHGLKLSSRALAWTLCVEKPYHLSFLHALRAVIIAEALNTMIPLGILISGTSKAVVVRKQMPFVIGLSSVAVENLFYSLATALLILGGSAAFLIVLQPEGNVTITVYALIAITTALIITGFLMVLQQWRLVSVFTIWLLGVRSPEVGAPSRFKVFRRKFFSSLIVNPSSLIDNVLRFENLIYGFYRNHPQRFLPVLLLNVAFHACGIFEVWFILQAISDTIINFQTAFLIESVNRITLIVFKMIPFLLGIDEAGASFVTDSLGIGEGLGVTLAIIRKGRVLFWAAVGVSLMARSGLSWRDLSSGSSKTKSSEENIGVSV
jgi:hypothetical protein